MRSGSCLTTSFRGGAPSYTWRSIWGAKSLLLEGLQWRVGNGNSIRVWNDAWLFDTPYQVPSPNSQSDPMMKVCDLIDVENKCWNVEVANRSLNANEAAILQSIPLSFRLPDDVRYWWPAKDGVFGVKSAYWLGKLGVENIRNQIVNDSKSLWDIVWKNDMPPKLKHVLWRISTDCVAYGGNLYRRHICSTAACKLCNCPYEDIFHAIFECSKVQDVWSRKGFRSLILEAPDTSFSDLLIWINGKLSAEAFARFCAIVWACWTIRNKLFFDDYIRDTMELVEGFIRLVQDSTLFFNCTNRYGHGCDVVTSFSCWKKPNPGEIKVNWDAAVFENKAGLGVVVRDDTGNICAIVSKQISAKLTPAMAEALAARIGVETCLRMGYRKVYCEGDAINIVRLIQNGSIGFAPYNMIIDDIKEVLLSFESYNVGHVKREGNAVAHRVARICFEGDGDVEMFDNFPPGILYLANIDCLSS